MRARGSELISDETSVTVVFEGRQITARRGETIAAALAAQGIIGLRTTRTGAERSLFCGMGVCQDCRVVVDGKHAMRACMTKIIAPMRIERQPPRAAAQVRADDQRTRRSLPAIAPDILVIGGGAAGLAAATAAARAGLHVVLADDRPTAGGQFYKQLAPGPDLPADRFADRQMLRGRDRILRAREAGVTIHSGMEVVAAFQPMSLLLGGDDGMRMARPSKLIVATGAYERARPIPGWTLPGVMTAGAVQTLLRSYRVLAGRRILIAGNGPLNLQVALEAARAGADIVAVAELASTRGMARLAALTRMATHSPALTAKGAAIRAELMLRRVPVLAGVRLSRIRAAGGSLVAEFSNPGSSQVSRHEADIIAMGYGFQPNNDVLRLLGCRFARDERWDMLVPVRDADGMTSLEGLYAVGDCASFSGAEIAEIEGTIAGMAAARSLGREAAGAAEAGLRRKLERHRGFQAGLWRLFAAMEPAGAAPPAAETVICRCEDVTQAQLTQVVEDGAAVLGNVKRSTRIGMGPCQGRYCGVSGRSALAGTANHPQGEDAYWAARPPIKPVAIADLIAGLAEEGNQPSTSASASISTS